MPAIKLCFQHYFEYEVLVRRSGKLKTCDNKMHYIYELITACMSNDQSLLLNSKEKLSQCIDLDPDLIV